MPSGELGTGLCPTTPDGPHSVGTGTLYQGTKCMATSLTRNLKLRISSNLTADAKFNLERLDLLGSTFLVDTQNSLNLRSEVDINIVPESADIGGSGVGGVVNVGSAAQNITSLNLFANQVNFSDPIGILDNAVGGNKYLRVAYKSNIIGSTDTTADRTLSLDLEGGDRSIVMQQDLSLLGGFSTTLTSTAVTSLILPITGTLATLAGIETLSNKTLVLPETDIISVQDKVRLVDNGSYAVGLKAPTSLTADYTLVFPPDDGDVGQLLSTDGSGTLGWVTVGGTGTVTSVDVTVPPSILLATGGPVTTAGTIDLSLIDQVANTIFSGPTSGPNGTPSFRPLELADIPVTQLVSTDSGIRALAGVLVVDPTDAPLKASPASLDSILIADASDSNSLKKITLASLAPVIGGASFLDTWTTGTSKVVSHNFGTRDVEVYLYELDSLEKIEVDTVVHTDVNSVTLNSSVAPTGAGRRIIVRQA